MLVKTYCAAVNGLEVTTVKVEVSVEAGQNISLSGLGDEAVRESLSRIRTAFLYNKYKFPHASITVNLAPADLRKEGTVFDLPIAIGILAANEGMPTTHLHEYMLIGELSLDGNYSLSAAHYPLPYLQGRRNIRALSCQRRMRERLQWWIDWRSMVWNRCQMWYSFFQIWQMLSL